MARIVGFAGGAFVNVNLDEPGTDTIPDAYDDFVDQFNVTAGSVRTSNSVTPVGYDAPTTISVSGADTEYSINFAAFTNAPGTLNPGESFRLRHTASGSASTTVTSNVDVGGVTATFESTTAGAGGTGNISPIAALIQRRRMN